MRSAECARDEIGTGVPWELDKLNSLQFLCVQSSLPSGGPGEGSPLLTLVLCVSLRLRIGRELAVGQLVVAGCFVLTILQHNS